MTDKSHLLYSIPDACAELGVQRSTIYNLISARRIVARKIGRRTVLTGESLRAFAEALPEAEIRKVPS